MGDGFEEIYKKSSLAGPIEKVVAGSATVWKTDFTCPKTEYRRGYRQLKVDHREKFDFAPNSFDQIIMRQGICVCGGTSDTCGGFKAEREDALRFMLEVARILNKNNESAMAYLHGPHRNPKAEEFRKVELAAEEVWKYAANALEKDYPGIEVKLIYFNSPVPHKANAVSDHDCCKAG